MTLIAALFILLAAAPALPPDVRLERDIPYLGPDRNEKADLYLPAKIPAGRRIPAVVIIHGGGWTGGDKAAARELNIGGTLASNGYAALSINYRLGPKDNRLLAWPQNLHDCKTAVRWLRANADRYQLDAAHIGVIGGSAGGHLSAMVGVTQPRDGLEPQDPYGDVPSSVSCVVDMYGPRYKSSIWKNK
ncbi:MAG: alpha/beta hydrolase [Verrucomicrobia bacterium]|nr:alpha/beta hydrolase [Verrucomicrobiota bacterium]